MHLVIRVTVCFDVKNKRMSNIIFNLSDFFIMAGALLSVGSVSDKKRELDEMNHEGEG